MKRDKLQKLVEQYDRKADTAFRNYQDTGIARYDTARRNNEDMADALRMALNAEAEHTACVNMRCSIAQWASDIQRKKLNKDPMGQGTKQLLNDILAFAKMCGFIREE